MLLEGKTVLITGASRGIGRGTALECARQGADVALNWYRDREGIDATVAAVKALGRRVIEVEGDVAERSSASRFIAAAARELGSVDVFVSNAGICPFHAFLDTPPETLERTMAVNLHGAYYMPLRSGPTRSAATPSCRGLSQPTSTRRTWRTPGSAPTWSRASR